MTTRVEREKWGWGSWGWRERHKPLKTVLDNAENLVQKSTRKHQNVKNMLYKEREIPHSLMDSQYLKMPILLKSIHNLNAISNKIPSEFFMELNKLM